MAFSKLTQTSTKGYYSNATVKVSAEIVVPRFRNCERRINAPLSWPKSGSGDRSKRQYRVAREVPEWQNLNI